jgi:hypothetical protein
MKRILSFAVSTFLGAAVCLLVQARGFGQPYSIPSTCDPEVAAGQAARNHQPLPGDRPNIADDDSVIVSNIVGTITAPIERIAGTITAPIERIAGMLGLNSNTDPGIQTAGRNVNRFQTAGRNYNRQRNGL